MANLDNIKVGDTVIYAETGCQNVQGTVTEFDPFTNTVKLTDMDGTMRVELDLVFWFIVNPRKSVH